MGRKDVAKAFYRSLEEYTTEKRRKAVRRFFFGCFIAAVALLTVIVWSNYGMPYGTAFIGAAFIAYWLIGRSAAVVRKV